MTTTKQATTLPMVVYDVLVLGAGLAGLGAGRELRRSGRSVCLLEAQDRPGGRVRTVKMLTKEVETTGTAMAEGGAQWIHGKENLLYKIAEENDFISPELGEEACGKFIRNDGTVIDDDLVKRVDFAVGQILEDCEKYVACPMEKDVSIRDYLEEKIKAYLLANPGIDAVAARQLLDWHIRFQIIDNSCWDLRDVGVNEWGRYSFNGESCQAHVNLKNRFDEVVDVIIEKDIGQESIRCGREVISIEWGGDVSTVLCRNGESYSGRFIIATFSIGVLKQKGIFNPPLPETVQSTIDRMGYGTIDKIFLKYKRPFWESSFKGVQFVWTEKEDLNIPQWIKSMTGFDLVDGNVLIGWIGGPGAVEMEQLTDEEVIRDCIGVLEGLLRTTVPHPDEYYW